MTKLAKSAWLLLLFLLLLTPAWGEPPKPGTQWVQLDGRDVLLLPDAPGMPAAQRAEQMQRELGKLLENPAAPLLSVRQTGDHYELVSGDTVISEVTEADASLSGLGRAQLAPFWAGLLQDYLLAVRQERQGKHYPRAIGYSLAYLAVAGLIHLLLGTLMPRWRIHNLPLRVVVWSTAICLAGVEFPSTRSLAAVTFVRVILPCWWVCLVIAGATLLSRALDRTLEAYFGDLEKFWRKFPDRHPRPQRAQMLRQGVAVVLQSALVLTAVMVALRVAGVDVGQAVAGAGVIGVGVSLIARDSLSDWLAGAQIVSEDQFGVGDRITVGNYTGEVDFFSLRSTRLRLEDGSLLSLANSQVRTVINHASTRLLIVPWTIARREDLHESLSRVEAVVYQLSQELKQDVRLESYSNVDRDNLTVRILVPVDTQRSIEVRGDVLRRLTEKFAPPGRENPEGADDAGVIPD